MSTTKKGLFQSVFHQDLSGRPGQPKGKFSGPQIIPELELVLFKRPPVVDFGTVLIGDAKTCQVVVRNPKEHIQQLRVTRVPKAEKNFLVDATELKLMPKSSLILTIKWTPEISSGIRESISLQDVNRLTYKILLIGAAERQQVNSRPLLRTRRANLFVTQPINPTGKAKTSPTKIIKPPTSTVKIKTTSRIPISTEKKTDGIILRQRNARRISSLLVSRIAQAEKRNHAAKVLQRFFRSIKDRKKLRSIIKLQSYFRMIIQMKAYSKIVNNRNKAATQIQACYRGYVAMKRYESIRRSTLLLQSFCRAFIVRKKLEARRALEISSAVTIQKTFRGWCQRRHYQKMLNSAVLIQRIYRKHLASKRYKFIRRNVLFLQSQCRAFIARRNFENIKARRALEISSAITIQRTFRGWCQRRLFKKMLKSAVLIQSIYRGHLEAKRYESIRRSTLLLQSFCRAFIIRKKLKARRALEISSAVTIQKTFRGWCQRRHYQKMLNSAVLIQRIYRGHLASKKYKFIRRNVLLLQSQCRAFIARRNFENLKARRALEISSAITIQKTFRGWCQRRLFKKMLKAAILIQRIYRGFIVRRHMLRSILAIWRIQSGFLLSSHELYRQRLTI